MNVVFYLTAGDSLILPARVAEHLLTALAYDPDAALRLERLPLEQIPARTAAVRRQLALGHGAEFTSAEVNQGQLLRLCDALDQLVARAQSAGRDSRLGPIGGDL
jgi:hypothetical protein